MLSFRAKLGENGRIIIPAVCRRELNLKAGEELILRLDKEEVHISSLKHSLNKAQLLIRQHSKNKSLTAKLKAMRRKNAKNE